MGASADEKYAFYRPLQMLSYALDYSFWNLNPAGYHLTNIFLHILAALMLFWLIRVLFKDIILACLTGLFFVAHPLHSEAVTYISGRSDPLALIFFLLTFVVYVKRFRRPDFSFYTLTALTYSAALLSREQSLVLPLLFLLYHYGFKERVRPKPFSLFVVLSVAYIVLRLTVLRHLIAHVSFHSSALERLPGFFAAVFTYARLLILPFDLHMEYGWRLFSLADPKAILGLILLIAGIIYCWKRRIRGGISFFGLSWFILTLLPVSNLYPINAYMAEHWLYLPSIGFFLLVAGGVRSAYQRKELRIISLVLAAGILAFYSCLTLRQNLLWKDPIAFYERTLKYTPKSGRAMNNLANAYVDAGRYDEGVLLYKKTLETDPGFKTTYYNLANAYKKTGRNQEAISRYKKAIEVEPEYAPAYYNLANTYKELLQYDEAIPLYKSAIRINPGYVEAYNNLGIVYSARGERQEAISTFKKAIEIEPNDGTSYANLAVEYYYEQNYDLAARYSDRAIGLGAKVNPEFLRLLSRYRQKDSSGQ